MAVFFPHYMSHGGAGSHLLLHGFTDCGGGITDFSQQK